MTTLIPKYDLMNGGSTPTGVINRPINQKLSETVSVKDFGAIGDGVTDDTVALAAARAYIASQSIPSILLFPAGTYVYSTSPNWAIQNAVIQSEGEVILQYTGTGNAVILDAGNSALIYNVTMGDFIVNCPSTANNGVFLRSVHHSNLTFNIKGAGTTYAGFYTQFSVASVFNITVSVNESGWYLGAKPAIGINLGQRNAGETTSYCTFINPVVEGPSIGIQLSNTLGNIFLGGTSEGCSSYGVYGLTDCSADLFMGTDFEVNTIADVYILGSNVELRKCDSSSIVNFGTSSSNCVLDGGSHQTIILDTNSKNNTAINARYNRLQTSGYFNDAGVNSYVSNIVSVATNLRYLTGTLSYSPGTIAGGTTSTATVTVPGAKLGDVCSSSFSVNASGIALTSIVVSANTVNVYFQNITGAPVTLGSGTVKSIIFRG